MESTLTEVKKGICVFDLHHPEHDKPLWNNILKVCDNFKPDIFLFGGDNMDMQTVSHWLHDGGNRRKLENKRLKKDYESFQTEILDPLENILPDTCRKIILKGNHEKWIEEYLDKSPELEGLIELEKNLKLDDWEVVENGLFKKIGKMYFHHGDFSDAQYQPKNKTQKALDINHRNIFFGHNHGVQVSTGIAPIDCEPHISMMFPCACTKNPDYSKNKAKAWFAGFGVFYVLPNGDFNIYPIISIKGHFVFNGEYY